MEDKKSKSLVSDDSYFIWVVGVFFLLALLDKGQKWFRVWVRYANHQMLMAAITGALVAVIYAWAAKMRGDAVEKRKREQAIIGPGDHAVYAGKTDKQEDVFIKPHQRVMHTQVIGTTNAGKTESVHLPWAIQDIEQGRGLVLIDGKADRALLDKLWAYTVKAGREKDFRLFSLSNIEESQAFNPLLGGTAEEISERVFNSFEFENPHYRSIQFEVFSQVMRIFEGAGEVPTFLRIHQAISNPHALVALARDVADVSLKQWAEYFRDLPANERLQRTSGLTAALSHFAFGRTASLFNTESPGITLGEALDKNQIIYFQLPVLLSPFLGKASGKMILQSLQSAIAHRHRGTNRSPKFYSVFLDDFSEYLYPGFVSVLNKSRSANVGIVFAHQALGDIKTLGEPIANSILTNANIKVFMRGNDPDSAEYFSKVIGTARAMKSTERHKKGFWQDEATGDKSVREVEEFIVHPNRFKRELGVGEAIMILPHEAGSRAFQIKFRKYDDLPALPLVLVPKIPVRGLQTLETKPDKTPLTKEAA